MGGFNSTRWEGHRKKTTVEDCLSLDADDLLDKLGREALMCPVQRQYRLNWVDARSGLPGYLIVHYDNRFGTNQLQLGYQACDVSGTWVEMVSKLELLASKTNFNGLRFWFACPLCRRRVGKLYLPPGKLHFACRHCHELTYTSAQTAHY